MLWFCLNYGIYVQYYVYLKIYVVLIEREIFNFVWDGKIELLRRNVCYFSKLNGGINLVDIRLKVSSLHLSQISKIIYRQDLTWTAFGNIWLGIKLKRFTDYYFTNLIPHCIEDLPSFYVKLRNVLDIVKNNDYLNLETPRTGGHCGFYVFNKHDIYWSEYRAKHFFSGESC